MDWQRVAFPEDCFAHCFERSTDALVTSVAGYRPTVDIHCRIPDERRAGVTGLTPHKRTDRLPQCWLLVAWHLLNLHKTILTHEISRHLSDESEPVVFRRSRKVPVHETETASTGGRECHLALSGVVDELVASLATGVPLLVAGARQLATPSSPGRTAIVPRVPVIEPYPDLPLSGFGLACTLLPWSGRH